MVGYFVVWLDVMFDCQVDFDDFQYVWSQVVVLLQFVFFVFEFVVQELVMIVDVGLGFFQLFVQGVVGYVQFELLVVFEIVEVVVGDFCVFFQCWVIFSFGIDQGGMQMFEGCVFDDVEFFVQVFVDLVELYFFDGQCVGIVFDVVVGEDLNVDDGIFGVGWYMQGGVFYVGCFFIEDCVQQFFFWSQLGFVFWSDFVDQDVVGLYFGVDVDDIGFVQFVQCGFVYVWDVCGDFFWVEFGVMSDVGQFLDVDCGEMIFLDYVFGQVDGVFEVEVVLGYECYVYVLVQGQFVYVGGWIVGQDVVVCDYVIFVYQWMLVDVGVLVGMGVFGQVVDVDICFVGFDFVICYVNYDMVGID